MFFPPINSFFHKLRRNAPARHNTRRAGSPFINRPKDAAAALFLNSCAGTPGSVPSLHNAARPGLSKPV